IPCAFLPKSKMMPSVGISGMIRNRMGLVKNFFGCFMPTPVIFHGTLCFTEKFSICHLPKKCSCIFWQTQSLAKYCVKAGCPNTHILKTVCSVLSSHLFLVFGSNLAFVPKNKNQMHFSGLYHDKSKRNCSYGALSLCA